MATVKISQLPPAPDGTGSGSSKGTDLFPATDTTDTSSSASGTTKKYTLSEINNFLLSAQGLVTYAAVRVATTAALTATYSNGASGVGATLTNATTQAALTIDAVPVAAGDRVLVWQQASNVQNGIYTVTNIGSVSTNWIMTRSTDYNSSSEIVQYGVLLVNQGTTYAGKLFQETGAGPFTIGTTPIIFALYSASGQVQPGTQNELAYYAVTGSTISGLATANDGVLITSSSGVPSWLANGITGQVLTATTSGTPSWISPAAAGIAWSGIAGTTQIAAVNSGYVVQNASQTTITLPATAAIGSVVSVRGLGAAGWILKANTGQTIKLGSQTTSSGGTLTNAEQYDTVDVTCIVANTTWEVNGVVSSGLTYA